MRLFVLGEESETGAVECLLLCRILSHNRGEGPLPIRGPQQEGEALAASDDTCPEESARGLAVDPL